MSNEKEAFLQTLNAIPQGYFTSYGVLAQLCGVHVRQVMAWLRTLPNDTALPWYRVINSQRKISSHPKAIFQASILSSEGLLPDNKTGRYPCERYWPKCSNL